MDAEAVRSPLEARQRSRRTLDQSLSLRFPRLAAAISRMFGRLAPSARLRRAALPRAVRLASEAYNRRDLALVTIGWHPECEYIPGREWIEAGLVEASYSGAEGYRRYVATTSEVWGDENYLMPFELVDLGGRFVVMATVPMRAQGSGVALTEEFAYVATLEAGSVIRMQEFYDHSEALLAVGLAE
jgi:hypothetical protein